MKFRFFHQLDSTDCGPACLQMISYHYGKAYRLTTLRERSYITREGVTMLGISAAAESIGFKTLGVQITYDQLKNEAPLPCIAHLDQRHFVVIYNIFKRKGEEFIQIADPARGKRILKSNDFLSTWISEPETKTGICLLLEPVKNFSEKNGEFQPISRWKFLLPYIKPRQRALYLIFLGMLAGSLIQLVFPFLTQAIVDKGIQQKDIGFIILILLGQLALFLGLTTVEFIRSRILLIISTRINISLVSDFLIKIMKLPLGFFDSKNIGDLMQRIQDHQRLQSFLTISSLNVLFSTMTFLLFSGVLWYYNFKIFLIFFAGSLLYALWVFIFIKRRREIDYQRFSRTAENQNTLIQLITGMQEIKLYNCEERKRNEWEKIQEQLYELSLKSLTLFQNQSAGALFFMRTKDIVISFFVAVMVIKGSLTLGMMLSIQFILGQLSNPVEQLVNFIREAQDASISMERLEEINALKDEEVSDKTGRKSLPVNREIRVKKVSFQYEGPHSVYVLKDVDITIPENRITAIVGSSGSGKTTLIKLLLGFYKPVSGEILIGEHLLESFSGSFWRSQCGSVMQDGYIFSDTIENNISMSDPVADREKLQDAIRCANLNSFIHDLPSGVKTRIGQEGAGISEGQKQRLLIARAVYRNPSYLFFDEATNSLDSLNEQIIVENLNSVFRGKTVVVVAHRLSTVRHADQIIVLDQGSVVEQGTHEELILKKSFYYRLVYNQLELG